MNYSLWWTTKQMTYAPPQTWSLVIEVRPTELDLITAQCRWSPVGNYVSEPLGNVDVVRADAAPKISLIPYSWIAKTTQSGGMMHLSSSKKAGFEQLQKTRSEHIQYSVNSMLLNYICLEKHGNRRLTLGKLWLQAVCNRRIKWVMPWSLFE